MSADAAGRRRLRALVGAGPAEAHTDLRPFGEEGLARLTKGRPLAGVPAVRGGREGAATGEQRRLRGVYVMALIGRLRNYALSDFVRPGRSG